MFPTPIVTGLMALATLSPPLAYIPQERVPPLFTSELPLKKPAAPPEAVKAHAPKPVVLSF